MESLELRAQAEDEIEDSSFRNIDAYSVSLGKEFSRSDSYSNETKFALQRLETYSCEVKME